MDTRICKECGQEKPIEMFISTNKVFRVNHLRTCRACYNDQSRMAYDKRKEKSGYIRRYYEVCSVCKGPKHKTTSSKCQPCQSRYTNDRKMIEASKPPNLRDEVKCFVDRIIFDNMQVSLNDINDIVTYYLYTTTRVYEFDVYTTGTQIMMMFQRLVEYSKGKDEVKIRKKYTRKK